MVVVAMFAVRSEYIPPIVQADETPMWAAVLGSPEANLSEDASNSDEFSMLGIARNYVL